MTEVATLGDVLSRFGGSIKTGPFGTTLKAHEYSTDGVPIISVGEVGYGALRLREDTPMAPEGVTSRLPEYVLEAGDIVFGRKGAVDRSAWVKNTEAGWFLGSDGIRLRLPSSVDSRFVAYQFQSEEVRTWLLQHASGSTMLSLNQRILERIPLQLPEISEQRAIAEVLGALDDKITANTKLASTSADLAGFIYDTAVFSQGTQPMSHVLKPILGGTPPRANLTYWEGDRLWASAKDVTSAPFGMIVNTAEKISEAAATTTKAKPLPVGSVILTARGTVGAVARLAVPSSFNQSCYGFVPGALPPGILYFSILRAMQRAKAIAHGSVFDTITMKTFDHLDIPVLSETSVETLESRIGPLLDVISEAVKENGTLANTRDALLPQLMSGKPRVNDAADIVGSLV